MALSLVDPLAGEGTATDGFGWRAGIPGVVAPQLHTGQDWQAPEGTPIVAAHAGRISRTYVDRFVDGTRAGGRMIEVGSARCVTRYAHLSRYAARAGDEVKAGQIIGYVGHDGAATADHLHFELLIGGQFVDPRPYIRKAAPVTKNEIEQIADRVVDKLLSRQITRADNPKEKTTLKSLISYTPGRMLEWRAAHARLEKLVRAITPKARE